jgi:acyl-[acyl-carrier-protein]-phospholipid O-acyltransferase/long-chain-fatty-acid--[acyl-carrier-protein] ligase
VIYLEDVRKELTSLDKAIGALSSLVPGMVHARHAAGPDDPAVVLFTSGTEGKPKGVVLSHANLVSNARQIFELAAGFLSERDVVMNPLPAFHSFGLTAALLMPLTAWHEGRALSEPAALQAGAEADRRDRRHFPVRHRHLSSGVCARCGPRRPQERALRRRRGRAGEARDPAGCGTLRHHHPRRLWLHRMLAGAGLQHAGGDREGSVGRLLPGIAARLEPVEGITEGGRLCVRGPNVMLGYLSADKPGRIVPPEGGWHDTGDIVTIDDGFVTIKGRAKRFAKLGGEMVSLAAVESMISGLWPGQNHVVVSLPDPRKGEQLVLVTEKPDADKAQLQDAAKRQGFPSSGCRAPSWSPPRFRCSATARSTMARHARSPPRDARCCDATIAAMVRA